ncbi:MAG: hypothetical protein OXH77_03835 [Anaerolineaceae bacterium]|nr:hypothetical protein [Anaerolineaceae bacterium]
MTPRRSEGPLIDHAGKLPDPPSTADLDAIQAPVRFELLALTEEQEAL